MLLGLIFLTLLTILSSLLVMFFTVTPLTSWLVLILSLIGIFIIKKAVILDSIEDPERKNKQKKNSFGFLFGYLDFRRSLPRTEFTPYFDTGIRGGNDKYYYGLRVAGYVVFLTAIFLFYSRYRTFSSSPLVWNILPGWFLPALLILLVISILLVLLNKKTQKQKNNETQKQKNPSSQTPIWDPNNEQQTTKRSFGFFFSFLDSRFRGNDDGVAYLFFPIIFLILPVLFPLGTDYDPFVHRAAEQTIVSQGFIHPRTFLYAGEYGLVSVLATITSLPVKAVNIYLLPILILLFLPRLLKKTLHSSFAPILLFILPFSLLTTTVPQGLGIFFLLVLLLFIRQKNNKITKTQNHENTISLPSSQTPIWDPETNTNKKRPVAFFFSFLDSRRSLPRTEFTPYFDTGIRGRNDNTLYPIPYTLYTLLAFASFLSHPFTGIAAFVFLGWKWITKHEARSTKHERNSNTETKKEENKRFGFSFLNFDIVSNFGFRISDFKAIFTPLFLVVSSLAIPAALYFNNYLPSQFSIQSITFNPNAIQTLKSIFDFGWVRYTDPLSFVYFFGKNYYLFFFLLVIIGIIHKITKSQKTQNQNNDVIAPVRRSFNEGGSGTKQSSTVILNSIQDPENKNKQKINKKWNNGTMEQLSYYVPYLFSFLSIATSSFLILFFFLPNVTSPEHTQLFTRIFSISLVFLWPLFLEGIQNLVSRNTEHGTRNQHSMSSRDLRSRDPETNTNKKRPFAFFFSFLDSRRSLPRTEFTPYFDTGIRGGNDKISFLPWAPIALLSVLIVSNIYLNFPHSDRFEAHKGYLVSQDDLSTVQKIEGIAQKPYLVLANQTVGAAALDQFEFAQYVTENTKSQKTQNQNKNVTAPVRRSFNEGGSGVKQSSTVIPDSIGNPENKKEKQKDANQQWNNETPTVNSKLRVTIRQAMKQYFYSIPVSSKAQDYFLQMLKNPSQELVDEIFQTYDIQELYLILNDYWKNSRIISRELSKIADETLTVGGNTVFKFFYTK